MHLIPHTPGTRQKAYRKDNVEDEKERRAKVCRFLRYP